jgi:hypothetical protein
MMALWFDFWPDDSGPWPTPAPPVDSDSSVHVSYHGRRYSTSFFEGFAWMHSLLSPL